MGRAIAIDARWDAEAGVWIATSEDVPGLVVEAATWPGMIEGVRLVLPELLEVSGKPADNLSLTFRAEERLEIPGPNGGPISGPHPNIAGKRLSSRPQRQRQP
jgi:hypothetical protein